jgi:hypothetical protein
MSPTGLRHHVRTQEELVAQTLNYALANAIEVAPDFPSFADCCLYYARQLFLYYADHPHAIRAQYSGHIVASAETARIHETILAHGVRAGFTVVEAHELWLAVVAALIGAAALQAGDRVLRAQGASIPAKILEAQDDKIYATPHVRAYQEAAPAPVDHFDKVILMLDGLRARYSNFA